ncbi:hypothetical protein GS493_08185 [Rhodococcus hoagii]|nr:hypothetical protein [Prescottella equi]
MDREFAAVSLAAASRQERGRRPRAAVRGAGLRIVMYCAEPRRTAILDAVGGDIFGAETMLAAERSPERSTKPYVRSGATPLARPSCVLGPSDLAAARRGGFALVIGVGRPGARNSCAAPVPTW